mgnify:CR=1 FL=1
MPAIYIDNKSYEVKAGKNLLETCLGLGIDLPYFCWHPAMGSVGACRQCAIKIYSGEDDTRGKIVMSCMEPVRDGLRVTVNDPQSKAFREQVIEWLMTNHPHDCPVCDEGGSCHLQDMTVMTGHDYRRYHFKKRTYRNQYLGPLIHHEMNRCIQCYRCVRFYRDYAGGDDLNVFAAHNHVYFGRESDGVLKSPFSGNLAEVCPTGVFTDKTLRKHYTRKWDLTSAPSVCQHCSLGCNTIAGERYGELRCITNRYNYDVNGYFLCDRGRFGYRFVNGENRITRPVIRDRVSEAANTEELFRQLRNLITGHTLIGIGSPRASMETNYALMDLVGHDNFYQGIDEDEAFLLRQVVDILGSGSVHCASLKEIEEADAVVVLGEDIWNTAPVMALAARQAVQRTAADSAATTVPIPAWNDAAIRELVQEGKGFLANCTTAGSELDKIASCIYRGAPANIARLGFAIASRLNSNMPAVQDEGEEIRQAADSIAAVLKNAKRPVIISGVNSCDDGLIRATYDLTAMLMDAGKQAGLAFVLPDCNSMGLAMLQAPSVEKAFDRVKLENNVTAIIAEVDLYNRIPGSRLDRFFSQCKNIVVLDTLHNATTEKAHVLIPAASFAEADGTFVNYEGRAQRFYQVYVPMNDYVIESWKWLIQIRTNQAGSLNGQEHHPAELLETMEQKIPLLKGISHAGLPHNFRIHGEPIPRETHRYSGRTAMLANVSVSEPRPLQDEDSPLTFTMEGYRGKPPASAIPFFWSPGWNSIQSVNKYQREIGGRLEDENNGVLLFSHNTGKAHSLFKDVPESFQPRAGKWLLLPKHHVYGSEELSRQSPELQELTPVAHLAISKRDAAKMNIANNDTVRLTTDDGEAALPVVIDETLCDGVALVFRNERTPEFDWGCWAGIEVNRKD